MALVAAVTLTVAGRTYATQKTMPYVSPTLHFRITPPVGWTQRAYSNNLVVFFEAMANPIRPASRPRSEIGAEPLSRSDSMSGALAKATTLRANIAVIVRPIGNLTLTRYVHDIWAKSIKRIGDKILAETSRSLDGVPAIAEMARQALSGEQPLQIREIFCVRDGKLLTLTLTAPPATFAKYSALFDKVLASFSWKPA